ncbi:hypothetical protein BXU08_15575 [Sphingomonas sp. LM7]|nr:hypothetical protein BXU08_15575 [Sphingomonas sp. LM7]
MQTTAKRPEAAASASIAAKAKRTRTVRNFPASDFEEPLEFAKQLLEFGAGQPVRRVSLFNHMGKSSESGGSRQLITNAGKYGLIKGSYQAELLELTPDGKKAADDQIQSRERARARIELAIMGVEPFKGLYERFKSLKLPAKAAMVDAAKELGVSSDAAEEAVDTFVVNLRFTGLLQTLSGADRIITVDHLLEELPTSGSLSGHATELPARTELMTSDQAHFESMAFYITPIGHEGAEQRQHSDLFLGSIVEPALESLKLTVVRADKIDRPGVITKQVIEYLMKARLVIADLSYHNPNVFYELAVRHMLKKPVVQIMRSLDTIPFDVNQVRTITIDTTSIYTLTPKLDAYRAEIATQVRRALENPDSVDSPISIFFPSDGTG